MDLFGVARTTIRRAIARLRDQAAIRMVPGRGSYVAKRESRPALPSPGGFRLQ